MCRIFCAPLFYVGFADFWLADQLNSLAPALTDLHYLICFYASPNSTVNSKDGKEQINNHSSSHLGVATSGVRLLGIAM
jgi:hypothetical protein